MTKNMKGALLTLASLMVVGCGGLSDVGNQDRADAAPVADAVVLNQPFSKSASGNVTTQVRAGTEVFVSGKDSDGIAAPVLKFEWTVPAEGAIASQVKLVTRNQNTVSFTAPMVTEDATLKLRLTVTDAKGSADQQDVDVTILGTPDQDHFLSYNLDDVRKVKLVAIASRDVAAAELAGVDVEFAITVRRLVDYTTPGVDGPYLELGSEVLTGKWLAAYGAGSTCEDVENPSFQTSVPAVDLDDIIAKVDISDAALEPNPALVDEFNVKLDISISVTAGALPPGVTAKVCADRIAPPAPTLQAQAKSHGGQFQQAQTDPLSGRLEIGLATLIGPPSSTQDTPDSTRAYYATLDPEARRTTFLDWLKFNGFIAPAANGFTWNELEGAGVHGVYTNNYDLGFGRDMYARIVRCDGAVPVLGQPIAQPTIGTCDIASVVVNYSSLEGASKKLNPVLAVAMEYSKPPGGERRIVQFYTFAPDSVTGNFVRVLSANLDGRGEKYMPQVCTACHGGAPGGLTAQGAYANGGDVNATFLPWDLDAFLYADAEGPTADRSYTDQAQRQLYTHAAQADNLRKLNQIAYLTYSDASRPNRYVLSRQLVEGWYATQGTAAFTSATFNGQFVPAGWTSNGVDAVPGTADDNPADGATLYRDVFARHCRACHVAQDPATGAGGGQLESFAGGGTTFNTCDNELVRDQNGRVIEPLSIGSGRQAPFACYRQFFNAPSLPQRLAAGQMPFARLTMDRFWLDAGSAVSAGKAIFDHLAREYAAANDMEKLAALKLPGTPEARVQITTLQAAPADMGSEVLLDGTASQFADNFKWSLERCNTAESLVSSCRPAVLAEPDAASLNCSVVTAGLVGESSPSATFEVRETGFYRAGLSVSDAASTASAILTVPDWKPCATAAGVADMGSAQIGTAVDVGLAAQFTRGNGDLARHRLFTSSSGPLSVAPGECSTAAGCAGNTSVTFTPTGVATSDVTVTLRDQDGDDSAVLTTRLTGTSTLTAVNIVARNNDGLFFQANDAVPLDILASNGSPSNAIVEILTQTCPDGSIDSACLRNPALSASTQKATIQASASGFTYTPPANFSTHDSGGVAQYDAASGRFLERISYRLRRTDNMNDFSNIATVEIPVRARTTFAATAAVWTTMGSACRGCHFTGGAGAPTYLASGDYASLRNGTVNATGGVKVDLAAPASSGLLCYPLRTCAGVPVHLYHGSEADVATIRAWIESGANNY